MLVSLSPDNFTCEEQTNACAVRYTHKLNHNSAVHCSTVQLRVQCKHCTAVLQYSILQCRTGHTVTYKGSSTVQCECCTAVLHYNTAHCKCNTVHNVVQSSTANSTLGVPVRCASQGAAIATPTYSCQQAATDATRHIVITTPLINAHGRK